MDSRKKFNYPIAGQDYDPDAPMCQDDYEMLSRTTYTAGASNSQGASIRIDGRWSSVSGAAAAARAELGSGWKVAIYDNYGNVVKEFTIR